MSRYPDAWSAVRGNPWRFLTSAWPWRSLAYLFTTVPLGIVAFLVLAVVVGLGLLTAVIVVGLVLLASLPLVTTVVAEIDGATPAVLPKPSARETTPLQERLRTWRTLPVSWSRSVMWCSLRRSSGSSTPPC